MGDAAEERAQLVALLEKALALTKDLDEGLIGYLIEQALDVARVSLVRWMPKPNPE